MSEIIAWTYEADYHCPDCAWARFGWSLGNPNTVDSEGNPIHPVYEWDEAPIHGIVCGDCGDVIVPSVEAWADVWVEEDGYVIIQVFVGRDVFSSYEVARWEGDEVYQVVEEHHLVDRESLRESVLNHCRKHGLLKWNGQELDI